MATDQLINKTQGDAIIAGLAAIKNAINDQPVPTQVEDVVADAFDVGVSYVPGDYCIYENKLYICDVAHHGAWDGNDFTLTTVGAELESLNNALSNKQDKLIDSGWKNLNTSYTAKYRKVGKEVEIIISTGAGINPSGTAASVGTLDEGFRPEYNLTVPMNFGATGNVLGYLSITASTGKVSSVQNSGSNQQYGNCNTMYFVP